jgi:starch synthase
VLTIHNLSYQGRFPLEDFPLTGLPRTYLSPRYLEYFGELRLLKGGIISADWITTVSPTYEKEIRTEIFGCGLDGVIRSRKENLTGILNGIDHREWDPARDELLPARFSVQNLRGKSTCKRALQREMGLAVESERPLIGLMSRLVEQKGIAQAVATIPWLAEAGAGIAVLGEGDPSYEFEIARLATLRPDRIAIRIGYNNELAHLMQAGIDYLMMPSIFEPCGLVQMYALRYGSIPVVRGVGGLADSIVDYATDPDNGTGFVFHSPDPGSLQAAVHRAMSVYRHRPVWNELRRRAMAQDFSWRLSAEKYRKLYREIVMKPRTPIGRRP